MPRAGGRVRRALAGVVLVAMAGPASAQTARLTVLADSVSAGVPFEIAVTVTHGPGQQVVFPAVPLGAPEAGTLAIGEAEATGVRRLPPIVRRGRGDVRADSAVYRAVVFTADSARVGPLAVRIGAASDSTTVRTGSVLVPVRSVLRGEAEPYEPAPIGPAQAFPSAAPLWVALALLAALVLGGLAWGLRRTRRRPGAHVVVSPYPAAVARLDALDQEAPTAGAPPDAIEAHVVATRDVLRSYLADRLAVPAREATTQEILDRLGPDARVPAEAVEAVRRALHPADLVAFARVRPAAEAVAGLRAATRAAVDAVERGLRDGEGTSDEAESAPASPLPQSPS